MLVGSPPRLLHKAGSQHGAGGGRRVAGGLRQRRETELQLRDYQGRSGSQAERGTPQAC